MKIVIFIQIGSCISPTLIIIVIMYNSQYCQVPEDPIQPPLTITMIYRSPFYEEGTNSPTANALDFGYCRENRVGARADLENFAWAIIIKIIFLEVLHVKYK